MLWWTPGPLAGTSPLTSIPCSGAHSTLQLPSDSAEAARVSVGRGGWTPESVLESNFCCLSLREFSDNFVLVLVFCFYFYLGKGPNM